jgi:hypothetical protein
MKFSLKYDAKKNDFAEAIAKLADPISEAGTLAVRRAAELAKKEARDSIGAAGFSKRWENTLRADVYPKRGESLNAAAAIYHKIPYAAVFEEGATIRGKPMLWVPMSHTPKKLARRKLTPEVFATSVGDLFSFKKGGRVFLSARMKVSRAEAQRGAPYKVRISALRRGAVGSAKGVVVSVPLFSGIDTVNIRKKFNVTKAVEDAAAKLPQYYNQFLKVD